MATDNPKLLSDDAVEAAITRVLQAEVAARDAVVRARGEATQIAERAREQARGLGLHTDRRIRRVRAAFVASHAWVAPPVSRQSRKLSTVPKASRPACAAARAPST